MTILHALTYLSTFIFIAVIIARIVRIASAPVHLRWELYPVPHEKGRSQYGGSRLEEVDWWTKKQEKDHIGEMKVMIPEIVFLKGVWEHNKELWTGSFPFHFGLYLFIVNMVLLFAAAIFSLAGSPVGAESSGIPLFLYYGITILIWAGAIIGTIGSIRIFFSRVLDEGLRLFSTASHYFNIILIGAIYVTAGMWILMHGNCVSQLTEYYSALIAFKAMPELPLIGYVHIYSTLVFLAYLPFTHMTHFITKYFTYHKIRWEDSPNVEGSKMQDKIMSYLNQPVTWSAEHIGADGKKTWLAIASSSPNKKEKENDKE